MLRSVQASLTLWPWQDAASWGGVVVVFTLILNTLDGRISTPRVINPIGFGVTTFFLLGGILALTQSDQTETTKRNRESARMWALQHPLWFAVPPALGVGVILFAVRIAVLGTRADGPWSTVADSTLDTVFRGVVVYIIIAVTGMIVQRRGDFPPSSSP